MVVGKINKSGVGKGEAQEAFLEIQVLGHFLLLLRVGVGFATGFRLVICPPLISPSPSLPASHLLLVNLLELWVPQGGFAFEEVATGDVSNRRSSDSLAGEIGLDEGRGGVALEVG